MTVFNSRTCSLAPMMTGNLSDEDDNHHASSDESVESEEGELCRLEIRNRKKVFTKSRHEPSKGKGGGKGKTHRECFPHQSRLQCQNSRQWRNLRPKEKAWETARMKKQRPHKMCHWGPLMWVLCVSVHGDEVDVDESTNETTEIDATIAT